MQPITANPEMPMSTQHKREEDARASMKAAVADFAANPVGATAILQSLQNANSRVFASAASLLLSVSDSSPAVNTIARLAAQDPHVIDLVLQETPLPPSAARLATRHLTGAEPLFGIRVIRKVIQDFKDVHNIPPSVALRLLQILDQPLDCSRLTPYLIQLMRHPSQHVRSKCVLLLGRGNLNMSRTREYLASQDPRIRANAVESLWDREDASTVKILQECSGDSHHRVAVTALAGLSRMGNAKASARLVNLASSAEPVVRAAAAWGLGHAKRPETMGEFKNVLETLTVDPEPNVQKMARTSLEKLSADG